MKKLKFAIIGCGRISYKHVEALAANREEAVLTAVCDIICEKAEKRKNEYVDKVGKDHVPAVYTDYKKMLKEQDIDVVTVATESGYHPEIAIYCMNNRKNVICEKPMALSIQDADAMIVASEKNHVKLCICHQNRFNKPVQQLRSAVEQHRFGRLINGTARILWNRNMDYYHQASWRGTWKLDGGTLMNQCIHNIDLLQWMMGGEIQSVYAQCDTFIRDIEAEDFGAIIIRFRNGSVGIVEGVCIGGLAVNRIETWKFADHRNIDDEVLKSQKGDPDTVYGFGHIPLFKNMIDAVNNNTKPLIDGKEGKKGMSIVLAAYKSRLTGMPVEFPIGDFSTLDMAGVKKINK